MSLNHTNPPSLVTKSFRSLLFRHLRRMRGGRLTVHDGCDVWHFGTDDAELSASITIHSRRMYRRMVSGGELGIAASLIDGDWSCDDLTALVRMAIRSSEVTSRMETGWGWFSQVWGRILHAWRRNTRGRARRNIHQHYDLGNEFYRLWLDETMNYSAAVFESPQVSLRDASVAKMRRCCESLALQPQDHLLEIGTGWGGLAVFAAESYGCRVTTTTISDEQYHFARHRVQQAGLEHRVTVLRQDYRDLRGTYDKLVSIEMIEAVGHEFLDTFFGKCGELLQPDGLMLLQAIVIEDCKYRSYLRSTDFIRHYIFPGGCLPSVGTLIAAASRAARMRPLLLEDLAPHYAETLRRWRHAFHARLSDIDRLGFDDRFVRMWDYYLAYCEAAFRERQVNDVQLLLAKNECRFDALTQVARSKGGHSPKHHAGDGPPWLDVVRGESSIASRAAAEPIHPKSHSLRHDKSFR